MAAKLKGSTVPQPVEKHHFQQLLICSLSQKAVRHKIST